jgi:putative transposase
MMRQDWIDMQTMRLRRKAPGANTSRAHPQRLVCPYLLRGSEVMRSNQVWCTDITGIPLDKGFVYLLAVMD